MSDQRALLLGRLASAIDGVADLASQLTPPATPPRAPSPPPLTARGRAWTLAAAMEPIPAPSPERAEPTRASFPMPPPAPPPPMQHHRPGLPAMVIGSTLLGLVLVVFVLVRVFSGTPEATRPLDVAGPIALTGVRPVSTAVPSGGVMPDTQISFPSGTATVNIEVNSGTTSVNAPVQVVVGVGRPSQRIFENDYVLNQSGDTVIPLSPASGSYAPGDYAVTITYDGAVLGSTAFSVA